MSAIQAITALLLLATGALLALPAGIARAADADEFKVKRQAVFEFTQKPKLTRNGDRVTITFASKAYCDATVAVENARGRIVRHLASGVLGRNAPPPFRKNSLRQSVVWDGKDDQGRYIDDMKDLTVRVSLGLKPRFERNLFWSPHKRMAYACPLLVATKEGVLVFEGHGVDFVRLYDHKGGYLRTIYPFPADKLGKVLGLKRRAFRQDGAKLPVKEAFLKSTLLTSGTSAIASIQYKFGNGLAATAMAVRGGRVILAYDRINRLALDGSTGGLSLSGPNISARWKYGGYGGHGGGSKVIGPASIALSPDGKWLYLTGYMWFAHYSQHGGHGRHGVYKLAVAGEAKPRLFAGTMQVDKGYGTDSAHFRVPASVACDAEGRVYVADFMNDRVQVFSPEGKLLKSIPATRPAKLLINPRTGDLWVFSWSIYGVDNNIVRATGYKRKVKPTLTRYGPFENPRKRSTVALPFGPNLSGFFINGPVIDVAVDWWAKPPTLWIAGRKNNISRVDAAWGGIGSYARRQRDPWSGDGIKLFVEKGGKWVLLRDFAAEARKAVVWIKPPDFSRQRLYVNPRDGKLFVGEDLGFGKSFKQLIEIDPRTGKSRLVQMPFDAEDICFDLDGLIYMRTDTLVARYNPRVWREVPWDYGEERKGVGHSSLGGGRRADIISGLPLPGLRPVCWNQGGMGISPRGLLVVSVASRAKARKRNPRAGPWERARAGDVGKPYSPPLFPGRMRWQEVHVWDRHGKPVHKDAMPGMTILHGVEIDRDGYIYSMASPNRILDGEPYFNPNAGTVVKFKPGKIKVASSHSRAQIPMAREAWPKRHRDVASGILGSAWVSGAEWLYGGVGFGGFNAGPGGGCDCWNSKFALDLFARSFAPEVDHYSVAVLDSAGNLILRVGTYGNVDSAGPASRVPLGGDGVGLFHAQYLATHTDRRLFIHDAGNARIVSVKLGYHASESIRLKDVPDRPKGR